MTDSKGQLAKSLADLQDRKLPARRQPLEPAIAMDRKPVRVLGDRLGEVWWRGRQWAVTSYGIEALNGKYSIEGKRLTEKLENYAWPQHMAGETWVDVDDFGTAWAIGLLLHGHGTNNQVTPERVLEAFEASRTEDQ